ncbi:UDP-N-acetylmuramate--L-alanine ligase [bacterium]|nr:UDP-N-acetylmuramate--L-alanine ligase [bacterium]
MKKDKYHFIAIGGIGMSGLAKYLLQEGFEVSGSDINDSKYMNELKNLGAKVFIGHDEKNLPEDCIVVASSAIKEDNPEIQKAKKLGLNILHRSDVLKTLSERSKCFIGYAGTHGKTTTSGLAAYVTDKAGLEPSYVVGGIIPDIHTNANYKSDKYFIAELDESDGTVVKYNPDILVINNLEADHLDFYKNGLSSLVETFEQLLSKMSENQKVLINNDCEGNLKLQRHKFVTYGLKDADYVAKNIVFTPEGSTFDVYYKGGLLVSLKIKLLGKHNVYNALAVLASLNEAGVDLSCVKDYFAEFTGMGRRFQHIGNVNGAVIYDDYAHHPTEIKATLSALTEFKDKNVIAVFQPHRYTRLQSLWNDFISAFENVSNVIVTDVFAASECPIDGISGKIFAEDLKKYCKNAEYISGSMQNVAKTLYPRLQENDIVVGLGAGTITELGKNLLKLNTDK